MTKNFLFFIIFFLILNSAYSQTSSVKGKIIAKDNAKPLVGAVVQLINEDNVSKYHVITQEKGTFEMSQCSSGSYNLKVTFIGYKTYTKTLNLTGKDINLNTISLVNSDIQTEQVEVEAKAPIGTQKNDTTELNASSFKTLPDANAEDLVKKMPGIQVDQSGAVTAQGESVKKVLVDGKPFFGDDPTLVLRNLPSDVIDKVQVYDKMSDQSEFTGFDDGNTVKTLNIITKSNRRNGQFGKFSGAYGDQGKYQVNANLNLFNGPQRLSILGMSNNINQQNFALMDMLDVIGTNSPQSQMFRSFLSHGGASMIQSRMGSGSGGQGFLSGGGPGSNFFVGQQDGINTTHAIGTNYTDNWGDKIDVNGSYFFNYQHNNNNQETDRQYLITGQTSQSSVLNSNQSSINLNHRFNFRFNYQIDSNNTLMIKPNITYQVNNSDKLSTQDNYITNNNILNSYKTLNNNNLNGYNASNEILFKHRFGIIGRTFSVDVITGANDKNSSGILISNPYYLNNLLINDTLNQTINYPNNGYNISANVAYTEPIHKDAQIMISYNANYTRSFADKKTNDLDSINNTFDIMDTLLSNKFDNSYFNQKAGLGYRYKINDFNLTASVDYQTAELKSLQDFPMSQIINYKFYNFLPTIRINFGNRRSSNFFFTYRASTNIPTITQLQNVIDNRNPQQQSVGNPDLKQQLTHQMSVRYNSMSSDFNNVFFAFLSVNLKNDYIANSTDSLPGNGYLFKPVNMDGYWGLNSMINYGLPIDFISSKMNFNLGGQLSRTPSLINKLTNFSNAYSANFTIQISSNISQNIDFNAWSRYNYNQTKNTLNSNQNLNYNMFQNYAQLKWIIWEGLFIQFDVTNQFYTGIAPSNSNFTLLNLSIGKKLLDNDHGELKLSIFDALKQNKSISSNFTDLYSEQVYNQSVLTRYVMLTFTYNLAKFAMSR